MALFESEKESIRREVVDEVSKAAQKVIHLHGFHPDREEIQQLVFECLNDGSVAGAISR